MRDQVRTLPGTGSTPVRVTTTDLYIHGDGGSAALIVDCGPLGFFETCVGDHSVPIDENFAFDVCLPPKPFESAVLSTLIEAGPGNTVPSIPPILDPVTATAATEPDRVA